MNNSESCLIGRVSREKVYKCREFTVKVKLKIFRHPSKSSSSRQHSNVLIF